MELSCFYQVQQQFEKQLEFNSADIYWEDILV